MSSKVPTILIRDFDQLVKLAKECGPKRMVIAAAEDIEILEAALIAHREGLAKSLLVGNRVKIRKLAEEANIGLNGFEIINVEDKAQAAHTAVEIVHRREADMLMKGLIETALLLHEVLDKEIGLRIGKLLSHVAVFKVPGYNRLMLMSDAGMNIAPTLADKVEIIKNAVQVANALGIKYPRVALLAAIEKVKYPEMIATWEAASLTKMNERGQIPGCIVDGPLALDDAISPESCKVKGIKSPLAGLADILVVPDIEAGNILYKSLVHFARAQMAGVILGAKVPINLVSRADSHETIFLSIALGTVLSESGLSY